MIEEQPKFRKVSELKGYEKFKDYWVFPSGNVYRVKKLSHHKNRNGYTRVRMSSGEHNRRSVLNHILVALGWLTDKVEKTHQVNHKDYDRDNPALENLEILTILENVEHRDARKKEEEPF